MEKIYCPLIKGSDGYMLECTELCGWHTTNHDNPDKDYQGECGISHLKTIGDELRAIQDALQDISITLNNLNEIIHNK